MGTQMVRWLDKLTFLIVHSPLLVLLWTEHGLLCFAPSLVFLLFGLSEVVSLRGIQLILW